MWPQFSYEEFKESGYLLHMLAQAIGKLKLYTPFEPQWSNVPLLLTSHGLNSGLIPYNGRTFSIDLDLINHQISCSTASGQCKGFKIQSQSVADLIQTLFKTLNSLDIHLTINPKPQEIANPIEFDKDTNIREYNPVITHAWWQILIKSYSVMEQYHARFSGKTPPIALMWGTLDLRDVRFNGVTVSPTGTNSGYIRRNAMNEEQIELGWWGGNDLYPHAAYYSFTYPQPKGIEEAKIKPQAAIWNNELSEFVLNYDDLLLSENPEKDLLAFFNSTYEAGASRAGWNPEFIGDGKPI